MYKLLTLRAYDDYVAAHGAGDDGRGDWEARKSCNYVNAAVGVCSFFGRETTGYDDDEGYDVIDFVDVYVVGVLYNFDGINWI